MTNSIIQAVVRLVFYKIAEPFDYYSVRKMNSQTDKPRVFLLGTPIHGNIGDHLIAQSESDFFKEYFSNYVLFDCSMEFTKKNINKLFELINQNDILAISGGGWLGSKWKYDELFVRNIIQLFPDNPIVIFPQTVFYDRKDEFFKQGISVYSSHDKLLFLVRDLASYDTVVNEGFVKDPERVYICPDFALFYKTQIQYNPKGKVGICFRNDKEKLIGEETVDRIKEYVGNNYFLFTTSRKNHVIPKRKRQKAIDHMLKTIAESKFIITDRLHAMIMAAVTGTPCLAFDNSTHKVSGAFKWLGSSDNIYLIDNYSSFVKAFNNLNNNQVEGRFYSDETTLITIKDLILEICVNGKRD